MTEGSDVVGMTKGIRVRKLVSINGKELNDLWIPAWEVLGKVGDSETIKRSLREAKEYDDLKKLAKMSGMEPFPFFLALSKKDEVNVRK